MGASLAKVSLNEKKKTAIQQNEKLDRKPMGRAKKERKDDETMHHYSRPNAAATLFDFLPDDKKPKHVVEESQEKSYGHPPRHFKNQERGGKPMRPKKNFNKVNHFNPRDVGFNAAASDSNYNDSFPNLHNSNPTPLPFSVVHSTAAPVAAPNVAPTLALSRGPQPSRDRQTPATVSRKQTSVNDQDFGQWDAGQFNSGPRNFGRKKTDQFGKKKRKDQRPRVANVGDTCLAKYWEDNQVSFFNRC